jgi:hypothetical protein
MTELLQIITSKPEWELKIKDKKIVDKWRAELAQQNVSNGVITKIFELLNKSLTKEKEFEQEDTYKWNLQVGVSPNDIWTTQCDCECMVCQGEEHLENELEDYDEDDEDYREIQNRLKKYKRVRCKCTDYPTKYPLEFLRNNISYKMKMIDRGLKERFVAHVKDFEATKGGKDYHPGSNNQMNDIIHPSLYCYVKDVSPVSSDTNTAKLVEKADLFQWLPSEFSVIRDGSGNPVRTEIRSDINNLPRNNHNTGLYEDIAEVFTSVVPEFEEILDKLKVEEKITALKGKTADVPEIKLGDCQVIVKIASAEVNSENPVFNEGSWHLEGVEAEKIIATCIYYYDVKNVEKTFLRFRTTVGRDVYDLHYPQNCHDYVEYHYGMKLTSKDYMEGAELTVSLGRIPTKENLCLFFPNFMQHRVSKIQLKEGCTEGHRGILVFFLINPFEKVISTANVSPQQQSGSMSLDEAKMYRELLMYERKFEYSEQNAFHQRIYSLCEH